ncbi:MAG: hypothetical protein AB6733_10805 [Clostridiaceae bacterium]
MNEEDKKEILGLVNWRKALQNTNGIIEEHYWKPLTRILSKDETNTIDFLKKCSDEEIYFISEVFEDISDDFQSRKFIEFLKELERAHPDIDIKSEIQSAEYSLLD